MEITYQLTLDKNYTKAVKKISRDIYKHNKFRKIMRIGDFLLYLFCLIPSLFIAFYIMNWAEVLYDYYENILAYYAGYILFVISMLSFFYALIIRPYLNMCMIKNQIGDKMEKGSQTIRIQEDGLYIKIDLCQTLYSYHYIHHIENELEKKHKLPIYREGRNYLDQYPMFLAFSYTFYKYVFPILFSLCIITKVIINIINKLSLPFLIISILATICLIIINISYFRFNYKLRKGGKKDGKA